MHSSNQTAASVEAPPPPRAVRIGVDLFFLYTGAVLLVLGLHMARTKTGWLLGDWLINYEGGFVRRGLAGEVFFLLGRITHISPSYFAVATYLSLSVVFLFSLRGLAQASSLNPWVVALLVSPAAVSYQVIHSSIAFRKEVLFLAGLSLFALITRKKNHNDAFLVAFLTLFTAVCVFSHEALFSYLPYLFAVLLLRGRTFGEGVRISALPLAVGAAAAVICGKHLGSATQATQICSSLGYNLSFVNDSTGVCAGGAIAYLVTTRATAGAETLDMILHYGFLWVFPSYAILALIPAVGESFRLRRMALRPRVHVVWIAAAISFLCTVVLFRYAIDWGRFLSVHISGITVLILIMDDRTEVSLTSVQQTEFQAPAYKLACGVLVLVYATCWTLPNDNEPLRWGYVGRALIAAHIVPRNNSVSRQRSE